VLFTNFSTPRPSPNVATINRAIPKRPCHQARRYLIEKASEDKLSQIYLPISLSLTVLEFSYAINYPSMTDVVLLVDSRDHLRSNRGDDNQTDSFVRHREVLSISLVLCGQYDSKCGVDEGEQGQANDAMKVSDLSPDLREDVIEVVDRRSLIVITG